MEEEDLTEFFKDCGEIRSVRKLRNGKAFVKFVTAEGQTNAFAKDNEEYNGRSIKIGPSFNKEEGA